MSNAETVLVTIHSRQHIPLVKLLGPILQPISMLKTTAETLKAMGIDIRFHEKKNVATDSQTGVRELTSEDEFNGAAEGSQVMPNTEYPESAIYNQDYLAGLSKEDLDYMHPDNTTDLNANAIATTTRELQADQRNITTKLGESSTSLLHQLVEGADPDEDFGLDDDSDDDDDFDGEDDE